MIYHGNQNFTILSIKLHTNKIFLLFEDIDTYKLLFFLIVRNIKLSTLNATVMHAFVNIFIGAI